MKHIETKRKEGIDRLHTVGNTPGPKTKTALRFRKLGIDLVVYVGDEEVCGKNNSFNLIIVSLPH